VKQNRPFDNPKPERLVYAQRKPIVDLRIRSHLHATLPPRPILCRLQQLLANPAPPQPFRDVPAFDIANRPRRIAMIRMRPQSGFKKTNQRLILCFRNKDHLRQSAGRYARENRFEFTPMLLCGRLGP
jgi:hypothetical protein